MWPLRANDVCYAGQTRPPESSMCHQLSVIIVNYNAGPLLRKCVESVYRQTTRLDFHLWVVDNGSRDGSAKKIQKEFPQATVLFSKDNLGFAKANNMAIRQSDSEYVLLLNPDTVILDRAIEKTVAFMESHPTTGVSGCKVLNEDGTLQLACRRAIPTPRIAFFRLSGLSRLFPKSRSMGKYNLTYLSSDKTHEVEAVSGSFLMIRREVIDQIGLLDERFFMYGEELDWCLRAKHAGWKIMYVPHGQVIHYKGECSRSNRRRAMYEYHRSMYLFHKKHFAAKCSLPVNGIVYAGIALRVLTSIPGFVFTTKVGSKR